MQLSIFKCCFYLLGILLSCSVSADNAYRVLVVHAYSQEYPWTKSQHQGFVNRLQEDSDVQVNFAVEYLDTKRLGLNEEYTAHLYDYIQAKYKTYQPDLVYVTDDNGYLFARDVLVKLFPESPVIFSGVNNYAVAEQVADLPIRGVFEQKQISQNLELFKELQSGVSSVLIVGDASKTYEAIKNEIQQQLNQYSGIRPVYISNDKISGLVNELKMHQVRHLFLTTIGGIKDDAGNNLTLKKIVSEIIAVDDFTVISMEDAYLYGGVLGGYVTSGYNQGQAAAGMALQYLSGKPILEIQNILDSPNQYIFDKSELDRLGLRLPENIASVATLINIPPTFYERNRLLIINLIALLGLLVIFFAWSMLWSRYRKKCELQEREATRVNRIERYQNALLDWSAVDFKNLDEAFNKATEITANTLKVARVSIWLYDEEQKLIECSDMYAGGNHHRGQVLKQKDFPNYFAYLKTGRPLLADDARTHAATSEFSEIYLKPNNIYSMLDVPLRYQGRIVGVVCLEHVKKFRNWSSHEKDFAMAIASAVSLSLEVAKRKMIEKHLEHQAYHDDLTGLPNRSLLMDRIEQAVKQAERNRTLFALLFLDLDNFKQINDSFGHAVGDQVLIETSRRLRNTLRQIDTIARLGGDEFTLLISGFEDVDEINDIALKLFDVLHEPIVVDDRELYVTSSIGIAVYPDDGSSPEILLQNADTAMYRAKEEGRNGFQFYTRDMTERAFEKILMISGLKRALERDEFEVFYQPQVDLAAPGSIGLEALIRWRHPDLDLLTPAKFIVAAEESGLIVALDRWVMRSALKQLRQWKDDGMAIGRLSLNLAMQQLMQPDLLDFIKQTLEETRCEGNWLCLEVTEGQIMKDPEKSVLLLKQINDLGIKIAVDDFGTGYSSLSYLKKLPVDALKIDRSFIRDIPEDEDDTAIVRSVIALAESLRIDVIAEGVETLEQLEFLKREGCSRIQGYYFSPPKAAGDIVEFFKQPSNDG